MFTATKEAALADVKNLSSNSRPDGQGNAIDMHSVANKAGRKVRDLYNAASEEISSDIDIVTSQIRKKPVQSSMIALGTGFLLATLLRRL